MLEQHKVELNWLRMDYKRLEEIEPELTTAIWSLIEGRISDLESMIAQDEYWEKRGN